MVLQLRRMIIKVKRVAFKKDYTIGKLYIDGKYVCDTLEDRDRGLDDSMNEEDIKRKKVYGETAIPYGTYKVSITFSIKFKKMLPLIENVKGFSGIRIHSGNTAKDSLGCILVGQNKEVGKVINSRKTFDKLFDLIKNEKNLFITISK